MKKDSIGKSTLLLTISKVLGLLINLVCVMILSRMRTLSEYGTYSQLMLAISITSSLFTLGLPNSINYFLAKSDGISSRKEFLSIYYTLNLMLSMVCGVCLVMAMPFLCVYYNNPDIVRYAWFLLFFPFSTFTIASVENVLVVYNKSKNIVLFRLGNSVGLLGILIVAYWFDAPFEIYMVMYLTIELIFAIIVYGMVSNFAGGIRLILRKSYVYEIAKFCVPLGLATAVGTISQELDKLTISGFFSTEEYAIYTNAAKEFPLAVLASATTTVVMPKIVALFHKGEKQNAIILWKEAFALNFIIMSLFVWGLIAFAPQVISILYSSKYLLGVGVFRIYSFILLFRCTYFGMMLNATGNTKYILRVSISQLCINIILNRILTRIIGFEGPAIATILVSLFGATVYCIITSKKLDCKIREMIPSKDMLLITGICVFLLVIFLNVQKILPLESFFSDIGEAILLGVVWSILYSLIVVRLVKKKWLLINRIGTLV